MDALIIKKMIKNCMVIILISLISVGYVYAQESADSKEIIEKIESLENRFKKLSEETEARKKFR